MGAFSVLFIAVHIVPEQCLVSSRCTINIFRVMESTVFLNTLVVLCSLIFTVTLLSSPLYKERLTEFEVTEKGHEVI